jgi:hypothetical protein
MKVTVWISCLVVSSSLRCVDAFVPVGSDSRMAPAAVMLPLSTPASSPGDGGEGGATDSRRDFMAKTIVTASSATLGGLGVLAPLPAHAVRGADKVNARLKA